MEIFTRGDMKEFARLVRLGRKKAGLTQAELAERIGVVQGNVSMLERGIHTPGPDIAVALEEELGSECPAERLNPVLSRFVKLYEARRARGRRT